MTTSLELTSMTQQLLNAAEAALANDNTNSLVKSELEMIRSGRPLLSDPLHAARLLGEAACRLKAGGEIRLALSILSLACEVKEWVGDREIIELSVFLSRTFQEKADINRSIDAYECLRHNTPGTKTSTLILASLYFRRGLTAEPSSCPHPSSLEDLAKAYSYRKDLLELCRVFASGCESNLSAGRPTKFDDILQVALLIRQSLYPAFIEQRSLFNPKLYSMLRASSRMLGRFQELEFIQRLWLIHARAQAENLYSLGKHQSCQASCFMAIDLHPSHSASSGDLSVFYKLLGLSSKQLKKTREAELYGRLSIASSYIPPWASTSIVDMASDIAVNNRVVLAYVSEMYLQMFEIWLKFFRCYETAGLLVIALDINASHWLRSKGIAHSTRPYFSHQRDFFWGTDFLHDRMEAVASLVSSGFDTLLTGVDSIWLKNPFAYINEQCADIVAMGLKSSVQNWPININNDFLFIKGGGAFVDHCPRLLEISKRLVSDQQAINLLLSDLGIHWMQDSHGAWIGEVNDAELSVYLLPESFSSRDVTTVTGSTSIIQPPGGYESKMKFIRSLEARYLNNGENI